MKQALKVVAEIKHLENTMHNGSAKHRNDCKKAIYRKKADLREYCQYRGFNYKELMGGK